MRPHNGETPPQKVGDVLKETVDHFSSVGTRMFVAISVIAVAVHIGVFFEISNWSIPAGSLQGKVAMITGANSGLGLATTRALATSGAKVFMVCRTLSACKVQIPWYAV